MPSSLSGETVPSRRRRPAWLVRGGKIVLAVIILAGLYRSGILDIELPSSAEIPIGPSLLAIVLCALTIPLLAYRWFLLLNANQTDMPFAAVFRLTGLALFCNMVLIGGSGGDALRSMMVVGRLEEGRTRALVSIAMDKWLGLLGLSAIGAVAIGLRWEQLHARPTLAAAATLIFAIFFAAVFLTAVAIYLASHRGRLYRTLTAPGQPVWIALIGKLVQAVGSYRYKPGILLAGLTLSVLGHALTMAGLLVFSRGWGNDVLDGAGYAVAMVFGLLANLLPLTPGGIGLGEVAFAKVADALATGEPVVTFATIFLLFRVIMLLGLLPGLIAYFVDRSRA